MSTATETNKPPVILIEGGVATVVSGDALILDLDALGFEVEEAGTDPITDLIGQAKEADAPDWVIALLNDRQ